MTNIETLKLLFSEIKERFEKMEPIERLQAIEMLKDLYSVELLKKYKVSK